MALPADYITGTITLTNGSVDFTGVGTGWLAADFREGDTIPYVAGGESFAPPIIQSITSNTAGTLTTPWAGPTLTGVAYRMRYQWDSSRVSAQTRTMIEQLGNGNLQSISALTGPGVLVFDGPHSTVVRPETDFINGVAYDVQVDTLADRASYDGQAAGFAVLVSDVGDGRSAVYSKNSNTVGDWSDPAYVTGPVGPLPVLQVGDTTTLPPGSDATVDIVPVTGGYELDFGIPEGEGFNWTGVYNIANAYVQDDVVRHNGSAFIAIQAVPAGNSPSNVFPPVDTAYWAVLAAKGQDGTGTGDVVGPASSIDRRLAVFSGTTGKLIAQSEALTSAQQGQARADIGVGVMDDMYNKIMNGGFLINQRTSGSGVVPVGGAVTFICDRWYIINTTNQPLNWQIIDASGYAIFTDPKNALVLSFPTAPTSGNVTIGQRVENVRTLAGRATTFGMHLLENPWGAGTGYIDQNFGAGGSAAVGAGSFAITAGAGSKRGSFTMPEVFSKTFGAGSNLSVNFLFTPRTTGAVLLAAPGLVEGNAVSETGMFRQRPEALELMLCRRYARRVGVREITTAAAAGSFFQSDMDVTDMRAVPASFVTSTADQLTNCSAVDAAVSAFGSTKVFRAFATSSAAGFAAFTAERFLDAEL